MRHLLGLGLAIVLTPLVYVAAGWSAANFEAAGGLDPAGVQGIVAAAIAGIGFAVLVLRRVSPVAPLTGGVALLGGTLWYLLGRESFVATFPNSLGGLRGVFTTPVPFGTTLLAMPLLAAGLNPRRWHPPAPPPR